MHVRKITALVIAAFFVSLATGSVKADTFHFSFVNLAANGGGTVMGTIILNATDTAATSLTVDSNTAGFGLGQYVGNPSSNAFTVVSGQITSANFFGTGPTSVACCTLAFDETPGIQGGFTNSTSTLPVLAVSSDSGVTFTPVNAVPLPAALPLFATGLGVLGLLGWRRKRKQTAVRTRLSQSASQYILAATISLLCVANAKAVPITYTESATVTGTLTSGGVVGSFTNALLTLTGTGNTTNITSPIGGSFVNKVTLSFTLSGGTGVGGSGTFTDSISVFVGQSFRAGFGDDTQLEEILDTNSNTAFASYALATSIGPITGSSFINSDVSFPTSAGDLLITSAGNATFASVVTPATPLPAALPLFATGLGALGLLGWRRKKKAAP